MGRSGPSEAQGGVRLSREEVGCRIGRPPANATSGPRARSRRKRSPSPSRGPGRPGNQRTVHEQKRGRSAGPCSRSCRPACICPPSLIHYPAVYAPGGPFLPHFSARLSAPRPAEMGPRLTLGVWVKNWRTRLCRFLVPSFRWLPGKPPIAAKPIIAERVKLPAKPAFHPQRFMDQRTALYYNKPLQFACQPDPGFDPFVKILAAPAEKIRLLRNLAASGRLDPLKCIAPAREDWGAGFFCVAKDAERDRLMLDRPANSLEAFPVRWFMC